MKNEQLFRRTVSILVKAYLNDTLIHGNCHACAVGNLVMEGMGYTLGRWRLIERAWLNADGNIVPPHWDNVFCSMQGWQYRRPLSLKGKALREIESTGYHWQELAEIECAFEMADRGKSTDEYNFNGLVAVFNALQQIHEATEKDRISAVSQLEAIREVRI